MNDQQNLKEISGCQLTYKTTLRTQTTLDEKQMETLKETNGFRWTSQNSLRKAMTFNEKQQP